MNQHQPLKAQKNCCSIILYWLSMTAILIYVMDIVVFFFLHSNLTISLITFLSSLYTIVVFLIASCSIAKDKAEVFYLYFLMDNTLIILLFTLLAWNFLAVIILAGQLDGIAILALVFFSLSYFMFVGNFRIFIVRYKWSKCEVILTKLIIIVGAMVFLVMSCLTMLEQGQAFSYLGSTTAAAIKDFAIFYAIALFTLYFDLYSKITNIDGTDKHFYHYGEEQEQMMQETEQNIHP